MAASSSTASRPSSSDLSSSSSATSTGQTTPLAERPGRGDDSEYGVLELPDSWHVLSLVLFLGALGSRFLVALLPEWIFPGWWRVMLPAFATPALAGLGLLFGLVGLRTLRGRRAARFGIFLNAVVLFWSALALWAFYWILPD